MSAISDQALSVARPVVMSSDSVTMPLLGVLWVVVNVALVGLVNGTVLSVIAVSVASERFQASAAGLLGGLSLSALRSDGSMISKAMQGLHNFADSVLNTMGIEVNEQLHHAIEQEALYIAWTMVFVVLASLVAEWVRSARAQT